MITNSTPQIPKSHGSEVVRRYKTQFGIHPNVEIAEDVILRHWRIERALAKQLIESAPSDRWEVFEQCYTQFYKELADLNSLWSFDSPAIFKESYAEWAHLVGQPPKRVYEIGSGKGGLIRYLANHGHECRGTEISRERGEKWVSPQPNLSWGVSDGVHLNQFEQANAYDVVISDQVIEHLHPGDLTDHFRGVFIILKRGGRYIFDTPHAFYGPSDISRVFRCETPQGLHLKEYTWQEIVHAVRQAGFVDTRAVLSLPYRVRRLFRSHPKLAASQAYLSYLLLLERVIGTIPTQRFRRLVTAVASKFVRFSGIRAVAEKPST